MGQSFAAVSAEQSPLDRSQLPSYLPSLPPPQVTELQVYTKLKSLKSTRSTLDVDIESKLRREVAVELATPLTNIVNTCWDTTFYIFEKFPKYSLCIVKTDM